MTVKKENGNGNNTPKPIEKRIYKDSCQSVPISQAPPPKPPPRQNND